VADPVRAVDAEPDLAGLRSVFQPIVELATGAVVAHEGLTRGPAGAWHRPEDLFARARATGHLAELDEHCRRLALATALTAMPMLFVHAGMGVWQIDYHMYFFAVFAMLAAFVDWRPVVPATDDFCGQEFLCPNKNAGLSAQVPADQRHVLLQLSVRLVGSALAADVGDWRERVADSHLRRIARRTRLYETHHGRI